MGLKSAAKPLLIACGILQPEIEALMARQDITAEAVFLNKYLHLDYRQLHNALKAALRKYRAKRPVVVYGDLCLGFNDEMQALLAAHNAIKVDGLNCIDCLLGGKGKLLEIDPDHRLYFLTPAFIEFSERAIASSRQENRHRFKMLKGIILLDSLGDMARHQRRIKRFSDQSGLPVLEHWHVGLGGLKAIVAGALEKRQAIHLSQP